LLYVRYDLALLRKTINRDVLPTRLPTMWRYADVLPEAEPVTLGEGFTPLLRSRENPNLFIKDDGLNPTGSCKARGISMAATVARASGVKKLAIASSGNAGSASAAYAAAAGLEAHIVLSQDVSRANLLECRTYGAHVTLVESPVGNCERLAGEHKQAEDWFDISALQEPFRVEGMKTAGYEIAEQMNWTLPDALIFPTGSGAGLIGMWKACQEMQTLGWLPGSSKLPKMIAVQSAGCAPIVKALDEGKTSSETWLRPRTLATGLQVPKACADYLILDILRRSGGTAIAVSDDEILKALHHWASVEGIFAAPEGAAALAGWGKLLAQGFLSAADKVVLFNTGSGLKYLDVIAETRRSKGVAPPPAMKIGGIIQPN
jgi:threonine synthase